LPPVRNKANLRKLALALLLAGAFTLYLASITRASFGYYHDDGIYVTTAKSLATGEGYRIISLPEAPAQTKYPPLYPFLLSLIWRMYPHFPENLTPMIIMSALTTVGCLLLTWLYLTRRGYASGWQALIVIGLTAFNWRTINISTGIYSEMLYTMLTITVLYMAEEEGQEESDYWRGAALGVLMGLAILARTAAITLVIAIVVYFLIHRKLKRVLLPVVIASIFLTAWLAWAHFSRTASDALNAAYYTDYFKHLRNVIADLQQQHGDKSRLAVILRIIGGNAFTGLLVMIPLVCLGMNYQDHADQYQAINLLWLGMLSSIFVLVVSGFRRGLVERIPLLHIYVVLYLAMHLLLPFGSYDRYLMPLLPFLFVFLITEIDWLARLVRREISARGEWARNLSAGFLALVLIAITILAFRNYVEGVYRAVSSSKTAYVDRARPDVEAIQWISMHTDSSDVLVCDRDPMYYLYSERKATRFTTFKPAFSVPNSEPERREETTLFRIISECNAQYLILTSNDLEQEAEPELQRGFYRTMVERYPRVFVPVFRSADGLCSIYYTHKEAIPDV
jgi:Gpi18-like mannosyltransferase